LISIHYRLLQQTDSNAILATSIQSLAKAIIENLSYSVS
jgi:hypothetical protein